MYALSNESKKDLQSYTISGTIGNVLFNDENILKGSLSIANQCTDSASFGLGGVYIGQMSCSFINVDIPENEWKDKIINMAVTINGVQTIPLGVWFVDSASKTRGIVNVKCYDGMMLFDKALSANTAAFDDTAYNILVWMCLNCGVTFGMTQAAVEALPNGAKRYHVAVGGDIETYRDLLYWISQTLGGFATMDKSGRLVVVTFHNTVDDTVDSNVRFNTSAYGDETITFTGFYWVNEENGTAEYESADPDDGYYISLGINPFYQTGAGDQYTADILTALGQIEYAPCDVTIPFGIHYDLGDVLQFPNGQGSETKKYCIMAYSWTYYGGYKIKSITKPKASKNKSDKNITALMRRSTSDEIEYYTFQNTSDIEVADGTYHDIIDIYFAANKKTIVLFQAELHCDVETTVDNITYNDAVADFKFYLNEALIENHNPVETWMDGKHIKHLMYCFIIQDAGVRRLRVRMTMNGGSAVIDLGNLRGVLYGQKLAASDSWNGRLTINEEASSFTIQNDIVFTDLEDSVSVPRIEPRPIDITETANAFNMATFTFNSASDDVDAREIIPNRIIEDGTSRVTEDGITRKADA